MGPFTVLVGANASGKSNIRDAFRFLHGIGRGYRLADIIGGRYGAGGQVEWAPIRGGIDEIVRFGEDQFTLTVETGLPGIFFDRYGIVVGEGRKEAAAFRVEDEYLRSRTFKPTATGPMSPDRMWDVFYEQAAVGRSDTGGSRRRSHALAHGQDRHPEEVRVSSDRWARPASDRPDSGRKARGAGTEVPCQGCPGRLGQHSLSRPLSGTDAATRVSGPDRAWRRWGQPAHSVERDLRRPEATRHSGRVDAGVDADG